MSSAGVITSLVAMFWGAIFFQAAGAFIGAALGFLVAEQVTSNALLKKITKQLAEIEQRKSEAISSPTISTPQNLVEPVSNTEQTTPQPERDNQIDNQAESAKIDNLQGASPESSPTTPQPAILPQVTEQVSIPLAIEAVAEISAVAEIAEVAEVAEVAIDILATERPSAHQEPTTPAANLRQRLWAIVSQGNPFVRVGVVVLFLGVAFLLRYAASAGFFPVELRAIGAAALGFLLCWIGWRTGQTRAQYGLVLQGGGIGILFITTYVAFRYLELLPPGFAFILLISIAVGTVYLALLQDAAVLAFAAVGGGFIAPLLASNGSGSHVSLLSYYLLLNVIIVAIAWSRSWRHLNLLGFAATLAITSIWGFQNYTDAAYASSQFFLVVFFLLYVAISILYASRQPPQLKGIVDSSLVFGVPLSAFALQSQLLSDTDFGLAISATILALFYSGLAWQIHKRAITTNHLLSESFLVLGITFASLAIPLAFSSQVTATIWVLEAPAILWISQRQNRRYGQITGLLMQLVAGYLFFIQADGTATSYSLSAFITGLVLLFDNASPVLTTPFLNASYMGSLLISIAGLISAALLRAPRTGEAPGPENMKPEMLAWGLLWWFGGALAEICRQFDGMAAANWLLLFAGLSAALAWRLHTRIPLLRPFKITEYLIAASALVMTYALLSGVHPWQGLGWLAWPLAYVISYQSLYDYRSDRPHRKRVNSIHIFVSLSLVLMASLGTQVFAVGFQFPPSISLSLLVLPAAGLLYAISRIPNWPFSLTRVYSGFVGKILIVAVFGWLLTALLNNGRIGPSIYIPLLNPVESAQILASYAIFIWIKRVKDENLFTEMELQWTKTVFNGLLFLQANVLVMRCYSAYAHIPWDLAPLMASNGLQTSFSVLWSLLAMSTMLRAAQQQQRKLWIVGSALMAVVVLKLFTVDLDATGTLARILSFMGVGALLLLVGYFSPIPPRTAEAEAV